MPYNERSKNITQGVTRAPNRSMYYAIGYQKSDFDKPMIGTCTATMYDMALRRLS